MKNFLLALFALLAVGLNAQKFDKQAIDGIFAEWDKPDVPGCALGIIKDGEMIYSRGFGLANLEHDIPNSPGSVFRIASTSKQFTAASIILLSLEGKLSLDDDLKGFFPDFPDYATAITVRHLLNHTSGIRDYLQIAYLKGLRDDDYYEDDEIMQWLINQTDLNFTPGDEYLYSNSGYWLLGQIVNKVAGKNMREYAFEKIFKPLKMTSTHFHNDHNEIVQNRASGYASDGNDGYKISMTTLDMIGDGGIFTTIEDAKKWDDAFYSHDVLGEDFWELMTLQGVLNNGEQIEYASGLSIGEYKGLKTIRHGGAFVGFRAEMLRFPEEHLTIVIFANRADANPSLKAERIAELLLKEKLTQTDKPENEDLITLGDIEEFELDQITGDYEIQTGIILKITAEQDSLNVLQNWDNSSYKIGRTIGNSFHKAKSENLSFTFSELEDGYAQTLAMVQYDRESVAKRRKPIDTTGVDLDEFAGNYFSPELNAEYTFVVLDMSLKLIVNGKTLAMDCNMSDQDQFTTEFGVIRFQRENDTISGFELDSGRVKNLRFAKR